MQVIEDDRQKFLEMRREEIATLAKNNQFQAITKEWLTAATEHRYSYHFDWLGLPIIQFPQDILAIQEVIWKTKPDIIIESGIARGGSLILSASILHLLNGNGKVIGIDIELRPHNRKAIENHPLSSRINLIEGSSIDEDVLQQIKKMVLPSDKVMVILDSNHTHDHVLQELQLYSPLVSKGCYLIVMDTIIEEMPVHMYPNRPWHQGNNPKTAVHEFLKNSERFLIDYQIQHKLMITVANDGYLKCIG